MVERCRSSSRFCSVNVSSLQEVEASSGLICAEELWTEGPSEQTFAEAGKGAGLQLETPVSSSFGEVQELLEAEDQLVQVSLTFWQV